MEYLIPSRIYTLWDLSRYILINQYHWFLYRDIKNLLERWTMQTLQTCSKRKHWSLQFRSILPNPMVLHLMRPVDVHILQLALWKGNQPNWLTWEDNGYHHSDIYVSSSEQISSRCNLLCLRKTKNLYLVTIWLWERKILQIKDKKILHWDLIYIVVYLNSIYTAVVLKIRI